MVEPRGQQGRTGERGAILLLMAAALTISATAFLLLYLNRSSLEWQTRNQDQIGMAEAREALLAWYVGNSCALPCPDLDGDGLADTSDDACQTYMGRVPWRELELSMKNRSMDEELVEGILSDKLWYVRAVDVSDDATDDATDDVLAAVSNPGVTIDTLNQVRSGNDRKNVDNYLESMESNDRKISFISEATTECFINGSEVCNDRWVTILRKDIDKLKDKVCP